MKIVLAVVAVALVGVIVWQALSCEREPVYQGKRLSEWLKTYMTANLNQRIQAELEAHEAVRRIGTNAIPTLLRMLRAKDSPLKVKLMDLAERHNIIKVYITAEDWNSEAVSGFEVLGTNAQSAVPALTRIVDQNISPTSRYYAIQALSGIGPPAAEAVPSLLRCATDTDPEVRGVAIVALGYIHAEPDRVVPVLMNALHDPDSEVRESTLVALERFGPDAKLAVPALVELLNDPNSCVRTFANYALKAIDPDVPRTQAFSIRARWP